MIFIYLQPFIQLKGVIMICYQIIFKELCTQAARRKPLNISMHFLSTVLCTFLKVLIKEFNSQELLLLVIISLTIWVTKTEFLLTADKLWEKEKYQLGNYKFIQYQILPTNITRTVWQTVRRIANVILGVKGWMSDFGVILWGEIRFWSLLWANVSGLLL